MALRDLNLSVVVIAGILVLSIFSNLWILHRILTHHGRYRRTEGYLFALFGALAGWWSLWSLLELLNPAIPASILFAKLQYISIVFLPPVWLIFLTYYTDAPSRWRGGLYLVLFPSLINLMMVWTNEGHHLVWTSFEFITEPFPHTVFERGFWFGAVIVPYAYLLLLISLLVLVRAFWTSTHTQRNQLFILLGAQLGPFLANGMYMFRLSPFDLTPLGFAVSSLLLGFGLFRYRLMKQLPIAYHRVFSQMRDGVLVFDNDHLLLDFNQSAQRYLGLSSKHYQQTFEQICPSILTENIWEQRHVEFSHGPVSLALDVTDLKGQQGSQGYILTVRDISHRVAQQEKLERQARELELLDRVRTVVANQFNLAEVMRSTVEAVAEVFGYRFVSVYLRYGDWLVLQYQVGYPRVIERVAISQGVIGKVVRTGEAALITNVEDTEEFLAAFEGICSEVAVPLVSQGHVTGVLSIESTDMIFDSSDVKVMMALSEHIGMAIERAKLYDAISSNEKQLRLLTENMNDLICLHDLDGRFSYVSPSSHSLLGYEPCELLGTLPFDLIHPDDIENVGRHFEILLKGQTPKPITHRCRQKTGEYIWVEVFAQPIFEQGKLTSIIASSRDVTERKRMQEQMLEGVLLYDALTGLPNRVLFMDRLQQAFNRRYRAVDEFAVIFLDLDRFKIVNDSLGHSVGDLLLVEVSKRIQSCVRAQDTVSRLSGDEFAMLVEHISYEELEHLAERIQHVLQQPLYIEQHEINTSASIGIMLGSHAEDPETLLRYADMAMYQAKNSGKDRYVFFDESMHARLKDTMRLEIDIKKSLDRAELKIFYQPVMSIPHNSLTGFEALVRWQHPEKGLISPDVFIPIAEEIGFISTLDFWVLSHACQQLNIWQQKSSFPLVMSVNVSAKTLLRGDFLSQLSSCIETYAIKSGQLKLEITESILMDPNTSRALLNNVRQLGVRIVIDDFGTGYSSLSYLHNLPLDSLKIDRSFIEGNQLNQQVIKTIILLAHNLHLDVVAEGIETIEQLDYLKSLSCNYGQGFWYGKPMTASDIEQRFLLNVPVLNAMAN